MDRVKIDLDIQFDKDEPFIVVDEKKREDILSAIKKAETDIQQLFRDECSSNCDSTALAQYAIYLESIVEDIKENLESLYDMRDRIESSTIDETGEMADLIQANIDDLWLTADRFYTLFGEYVHYNLLDFEKEIYDRESKKYKVKDWVNDKDINEIEEESEDSIDI